MIRRAWQRPAPFPPITSRSLDDSALFDGHPRSDEECRNCSHYRPDGPELGDCADDPAATVHLHDSCDQFEAK